MHCFCVELNLHAHLCFELQWLAEKDIGKKKKNCLEHVIHSVYFFMSEQKHIPH